MGKYVYLYRMTADSGNAPCVYIGYGENRKRSELLTLACCKGGQIRKGTDVHTGLRHFVGKRHHPVEVCDRWAPADEVWVIGVYKDCLLYAARVTEIMTMNAYFSTYRNRGDSIYKVKNGTLERSPDWNTDFHGPNESRSLHKKDCLGDYVLLSTDFVYLGKEYVSEVLESKPFQTIPKHQETKRYSDVLGTDDYDPKQLDRVMEWIKLPRKKTPTDAVPVDVGKKCSRVRGQLS